MSASLSSPIVDGDLIEASKENIQPLASGRRATALSAVLATPHAQRDRLLGLTRTRDRWRAIVQRAVWKAMSVGSDIDEGWSGEDEMDELGLNNGFDAYKDGDGDLDLDDPLDAYSGFVAWTLEQYPQGASAESGLLELLEEATRVLLRIRGPRRAKDGESEGEGTGEQLNGAFPYVYRHELRYMRLWVLYARFVERPEMIYSFCLANDVGVGCAILYEEFADSLERAGRHTQADKIFRLGIARQAAPLEHLKSRHREFQKRMMAGVGASSSEDKSSEMNSAETGGGAGDSERVRRSQGKRKALGPVTSSASLRLTTSASTPPAATRPAPTSNAKLQVYVDEPVSDGFPRVGFDTIGENDEDEDSATTPWPDLGTRKTRIKENVPEVRKAGGTTLRSARGRGTAGSGASVIVPYRDPDPGSAFEVEREADVGTGVGVKARTKTGTGSSAKVRSDTEGNAGARENGLSRLSSTSSWLNASKSSASTSMRQSSANTSTSARSSTSTRPSTSTRVSKLGSARSTIVPFIDEEDPDAVPAIPEEANEGDGEAEPDRKLVSVRQIRTPVSAPSRFVPFCDEEEAKPTSHPARAPASTLTPISIDRGTGVDGAGVAALSVISEMEALRRDPLKNYKGQEVVCGVELSGMELM